MVDGSKKGARGAQGPRSKNPLQVPVTSDERAIIVQTAETCGLSVAAMLRRLALGYNPPSISDLLMRRELVRLRGDFGRFGGLLKLWLVDAPGQGIPEEEVRALLHDTQEKMDEIIAFLAEFRRITDERERQR